MLTGKRIGSQVTKKPITAKLLNQLVTWTGNFQRLCATAPLNIQQTPGGPCISCGGPLLDVEIGVTTSTIGGATKDGNGNLVPGKGSVEIYARDKDSGAIVDFKQSFEAVYNLSVASIDNGVNVKIMKIGPDWWVFWQDCPGNGG